MIVTSYGRKNLDDEIKHSRTTPDVQFKEFSLTKQTTRPRTDYESIGITISKKNQIKNPKINVKMPHVNKKPLARKQILVKIKS